MIVMRTDYSRGREAEATLYFPLVYIEYMQEDVKPRVQHHKVIRAKLAEAGPSLGGARTIHELRGEKMELDVSRILVGLEEGGNLASKTWRYSDYEIRLNFKSPVRVGEYDNIEFIIMTYSPCWADTPEMREAHAEWRAQVASLE